MSSCFTVKEIAARFRVKQHTVLAWIRSGELIPLDASPNRGGKPQWRITPEALAAFEAARTVTPNPPRKKRRRKPDDMIDFYK